jgi:hypothetical protein
MAGSMLSKSPRMHDGPSISKHLVIRVIRFWNNEVFRDPEAVVESIRTALMEIPSP